MAEEIVIIKYNAGNIRSVLYALERIGREAVVTDDEGRIRRADKVIFPGVGEASTAMHYLRERGLHNLIGNLTQPVLGICLGMQLMCRHSEENDTECLGIFDENVKRFEAGDSGYKIPQIGWNKVKHMALPDIGATSGEPAFSHSPVTGAGQVNTDKGIIETRFSQRTDTGAGQVNTDKGIIETRFSQRPDTGAGQEISDNGNVIDSRTSPLFQGIQQGAYFYFVHSYYASTGPHTVGVADYVLPYSAALQRDNFYGVQFHPEKSAAAGEQLLKNFLAL